MDLVFDLVWPISFEVPLVAVILGLVVGLSYSVLALGIVLIYKSSRIINLAHGEVGAVAAASMALMVNDWGLSYWLALPLALLVAGGLGAIVERTVIRRLFKAPRLIVLVATLGVAQLFLLISYLLTQSVDNRAPGFPVPFRSSVTVGQFLVLNDRELMILLLVPLAALALAAFFRFTGFGVAIRASAENGESARLAGIPVKRVSTFVWMLAATLSGLTAIMLSPGKGLFTTESLGPGLLLRALAAAVIARMTSMPVAFAAGIAIGVVEQVVFWNYPIGGQVELILFLVILGALFVQTRAKDGPRTEETSTWSFTQMARPVPRALQGVAWVRRMNWIGALAALGAAAALPLVLSNSQTFMLTTVVAFAIVALSVTVLTGYAGQISLGQVGLFGVGAAASYQLTVNLYVPFWLSLLLAGAAGSALSVLIGVPALRIRGLFLAVTTLGFALVAQKWLIGQDWMAGIGAIAPRPYIGTTVDFATQRAYYVIALAGLVGAILVTRNLLRSGIGRNFVALRDNESGAAAFTIPVTRTKLIAFGASGFLAAFAGAIYGHGIERFGVNNFPVTDSLRVVSMTIIGGLGSIPGAILGAFFVIGIDRLVDVAWVRLLSTSVGLLALLMFLPGGFAQILYSCRDRLLGRLARKIEARQPGAHPMVAASSSQGDQPDMSVVLEQAGRLESAAHQRSLARTAPAASLLAVRGLRLHYGGVRALDGVDLDIAEGSILGLIGPNGAGKTTLFECIAGFNHPDQGQVTFGGVDVTSLGPEGRARLGLIRSFQDARLFPSLTVHQTVVASHERLQPSRLIDSVLSLPVERRRERTKAARADELISAMGLDAYRDKLIRELSTGTRRIVELACVLALEPRLLLLDEPSSGIAQRESEALGPVLRRVKELTGCTMVIIEHDIPLVMGLADEVVAMESGRVIARGAPDVIRHDPRVVASYLGTNETVIARSGVVNGDGAVRQRCGALTAAQEPCQNTARPGSLACGIAAHRHAIDREPAMSS